MYTLDSDWRAEGNTTGFRGTPQGFCVHHSAGTTLDMVPAFLANSTSAHYGVKNSHVRQFVADSQGAWAAGDAWANTNLLHIECVNSAGAPDWPVAEETVNTLVVFLANKCREHHIGQLTVGQNLFGHRDFYNTFCPGVLYDRLDEIANRVNTLLDSGTESEDDVSAQDVWNYDYEGTAPGGNMYNAVVNGMRELLNTSGTAAQDETGQHVDTGATPLARIPYIEGMLKQLGITDVAGAENETGEHVNTGANMALRLAYMEARQIKMERMLAAIVDKVIATDEGA